MMEILRCTRGTLLFFMAAVVLGCAPPIRYTPTATIPSSLPENIRANIEALYSVDPAERANAAQYLGSLGKEASASVPFLIDVLGDNRNVWQDLVCDKGVWKPFAIDCVDASVHYRKQVKSTVCSVVSTSLQKITGQNFKDNSLKWRTWWYQHQSGFADPQKDEPANSGNAATPIESGGTAPEHERVS